MSLQASHALLLVWCTWESADTHWYGTILDGIYETAVDTIVSAYYLI